MSCAYRDAFKSKIRLTHRPSSICQTRASLMVGRVQLYSFAQTASVSRLGFRVIMDAVQ